MITFPQRLALWCAALASLAVAAPAAAEMRITEYMYGGANGEFIEFTNVGNAPVDMSGWSFDDDSEAAGTVDLSAFGTVAAGESVILTETSAADFRTAWSLCDAVKVIGSNTTNLGRDDEINLFDASHAVVDRLTYGDDTLGGPRAQNKSAWVSAAGLGANIVTEWTLSVIADAESSYASSGGDIGSPGESTRATVAFAPCQPVAGVMRISEYMYGGANGEFIEFTNVGNAPVDMTGWSFADDAATPGIVDLGAYGTVEAGESVILTETAVADFRSAWNLCDGIKIIGGNTTNLGRNDQINLYDASQALVDRLSYGDQNFPGTIRTNGASGWVSAAGLGANIIQDWTLATVGDAEGSVASASGDIASPGRSSRASVLFDPCVGTPDAPVVGIDPATTSLFLDLVPASPGTVSGVIGDPTDPAATQGIGLVFSLPGGGDPATLTIAASSSNPAVVDASGLQLTGNGASRQLLIVPQGVGYSTITVSATDAANNTGTYVINYAASAPPALPDATRFHTGASDASATVAIDAQTMFVADDETNVLRLYRRDQSGLPLNGFDFSGQLNLTDPDNPELDLEGSTRIEDRVFWTTSFSNSKNFHVRPNRHRVFATDLAGTGVDATLAYVGRYDWLLEDLVAWDENNGHGLGANYLGFAASSADGVDSKTPAGFNIEGLAMAPDNSTAYFAFRAPLLPTTDRHQAVIVPVLNFAALITDAAPDSLAQGSATFGAPIFMDLGGRGIRSLDRNEAGQYLITTGPPGDATGIPPDDFHLYAWTGNPLDAPFDIALDMSALDIAGGSFESIAGMPDDLGAGSELQFLLDNGDSIWYDDGVAAKDLPDPRLKKAASLRVTVDVAYPATAVAVDTGTPQSAIVHEAFVIPLRLQVRDAYGHGVANVEVAFSAPADGASANLSAAAVTTDASGYASVQATANAIAGSYDVTASVKGVAPNAHFALTNLPGAPAAIAVTGGTPQSALVDQPFAEPLAVHVTDADGNAVSDVVVQFAAPVEGASANLSSTSATTDAEGNAAVNAGANAIAGSYDVLASIESGGTQAMFALTNLAGPPATIDAASGTPQSAVVSHAFANPLAVHVTDAEGNAVANATVVFAVPADGASAVLSALSVVTDANGDAAVTATANSIVGDYLVAATLDESGATALFELTNTIDAADVIFTNGFDPPAR